MLTWATENVFIGRNCEMPYGMYNRINMLILSCMSDCKTVQYGMPSCMLYAMHDGLNVLMHFTPCGRGTVVLIVSCRCTYCFPETTHGKITRQYLRFCAVAYMHKCELSYTYPGHDVKLYSHRVKL